MPQLLKSLGHLVAREPSMVDACEALESGWGRLFADDMFIMLFH